ncbi:hypothetical protein [Leptolyngbya sp. FACHB-261]|uniref:hypothetical protein n=1 Tax=Leptolyngbya sp. FACHB-261 TaxID=2692806 RepID=UPI001684E4D9|nr:hypothetical protein [Leptolyngbya sp. FACHB-261]MBD2102427.1 hypothetical protein [Leptolyngbya sp. FACHB-261]
MRYTDQQGNTLSLNQCMAANSFFMEDEMYSREPLEMHFTSTGELRAGKKPKNAGSELIATES